MDDIHKKHTKLIKPSWSNSIPPLQGLILAGGESQRMGVDKSTIHYHGLSQVDYLVTLLGPYVEEVFVSKRDDIESTHPVIKDTFLDLGPYGGVLSAFRFNPNCAWLTVPCDMPLVDQEMILKLINHRDPEKSATCFHDPSTGFPEPLLTIWEPRAYPLLLQNLGNGISCLRKTLINSDTKEVSSATPEKLKNANTPEESQYFKSILINPKLKSPR